MRTKYTKSVRFLRETFVLFKYLLVQRRVMNDFRTNIWTVTIPCLLLFVTSLMLRNIYIYNCVILKISSFGNVDGNRPGILTDDGGNDILQYDTGIQRIYRECPELIKIIEFRHFYKTHGDKECKLSLLQLLKYFC